jgi:predicted PurR-regulated permease PerM
MIMDGSHIPAASKNYPRLRDQKKLQPADRHLWQITPARDLIVFLLAAVLLWFVYELRGIFMPLFVALMLAYLFNPLVTRIEHRWRLPRALTTTLLLVVSSVAFFGFLAWLGPLLFEQAMLLAGRLPDYLRTLAATYDIDTGGFIERAELWIRQAQAEPQQILGQIFKTTGRAVGIITVVLNTATYLILSIVLIAVYFFFFAWHFNSGLAKLSTLLPESRKERVFAVGARMDEAVGEFFRGRLVIAVIMGILLSVGWFLAGVPYWFFLGMLTGVLNIVPYLSVISWPFAILLKYLDMLTSGSEQGFSFMSVFVWPSVVYIFVQFLEGWVLTPWIQSGQTNMSAVTIILVVFIGGAVAGVWGMLLAIPVAACIKILMEETALPALRRWAATH